MVCSSHHSATLELLEEFLEDGGQWGWMDFILVSYVSYFIMRGTWDEHVGVSWSRWSSLRIGVSGGTNTKGSVGGSNFIRPF